MRWEPKIVSRWGPFVTYTADQVPATEEQDGLKRIALELSEYRTTFGCRRARRKAQRLADRQNQRDRTEFPCSSAPTDTLTPEVKP